MFTQKTYDELKDMLREHYYCRADEPEVLTSAPEPDTTPAEPEPVAVGKDTVEEDIDDLLKDL